jgi:hypothetical protein
LDPLLCYDDVQFSIASLDDGAYTGIWDLLPFGEIDIFRDGVHAERVGHSGPTFPCCQARTNGLFTI